MPPKRKTYAKRKPKAKRVYRKKKTILAPGPTSFFPKHKSVTLKYMQAYKYNGNSNYLHVAQFQLNSLYAPEGSQTGWTRVYANAQPYYFDQISPQYDNYCVVKVKIKVSFNSEDYFPYNADSYQNSCYICTLRDNDDNSSLPANMQLECVRPNVSMKISSSGKIVSITKSFDIPKLGGITLNRYLADPLNWGGSVSPSSPTNIYYANACLQSAATYTANPSCYVEIWQTAMFMGPAQLGMS